MDALLGLWILALAVAGYAWIVRRTRDPIHPLGVFILSWLGVLSFAHFNVPRSFDEPYYAEPFGALTYAAALGALVAFSVGFVLVDRRFAPIDRGWISERLRSSVSPRRLGVWTLVLFVVASATAAWFVVLAGEIPLFSPRIDQLRLTFKRPLIGYLYDLHYTVALFAAMLAVWSRRRRARWAWGGVVAASLLELMLGGVRVSPLTALAWVFVFLAYRPAGLRKRGVLVATLLAALIFGVIEQYRRSIFTLDPNLVNPRVDLGVTATLWAHSAASFKNLQYTLDRVVSPLHMGLTSYDLPKTFSPESRSVDEELSYLYGTHNTPTFLSFLFFDFGWAGLFVMPGVYGALAALVYGRFRRQPSLFWLMVHIDFLLAVALSFRTHRFLGNSLIFFAGVAFLSQVLAGRERDSSQSGWVTAPPRSGLGPTQPPLPVET